ncbi:hypothetical protein HPP92_011771 [Vanilla planifolia]|uniref:Uncharacterized protein n=1 Tax=Vanilla planifolia TaxID=51239 RepID=A0A835QZQ0_VANPL|nr:hypothetical protein HPP92_011771 [Vanilla planifolia]
MDSGTSFGIEFGVQTDSQEPKQRKKHFSCRQLPPPLEPPPNLTRVRPTSQTRARVPPGLIDPHQSCATRATHATRTNPAAKDRDPDPCQPAAPTRPVKL